MFRGRGWHYRGVQRERLVLQGCVEREAGTTGLCRGRGWYYGGVQRERLKLRGCSEGEAGTTGVFRGRGWYYGGVQRERLELQGCSERETGTTGVCRGRGWYYTGVQRCSEGVQRLVLFVPYFVFNFRRNTSIKIRQYIWNIHIVKEGRYSLLSI